MKNQQGSGNIVLVYAVIFFSFFVFNTNVIASNADNSWFNDLRKVIKSGEIKDDTIILEEVVAKAIDSGAQTYVIIQTAMAMDSSVAGQMIRAVINVTQEPATVVKAAVVANVDLRTILTAAFSVSADVYKIVAACIDAGSDLDAVVSESIKARADIHPVIGAALVATNNISSVVNAASAAGVPVETIAEAVFSKKIRIDNVQAVGACIEAGIPVDTVIAAALASGADPAQVITTAINTSGDYQAVVNAAIDQKITRSELLDFTENNPSVDQDVLRVAIDTAESVLAYTPAPTNRTKPITSLNTESNGGNVSPH